MLDPGSATELLTMDHGLLMDQNSADFDNEFMHDEDIQSQQQYNPPMQIKQQPQPFDLRQLKQNLPAK